MTNKRKTLLTLPQEVVEAFTRAPNIAERNRYATALRAAGWTLQSISEATGVTRERVRQIVTDTDAVDSPVIGPIPAVPLHPEREPRVTPVPDSEKVAEAAALQTDARAVRGNGGLYRAAAERYTAIVMDLHLNDGIPLTRVAAALSAVAPESVTHSALRDRLVRYGYIPSNGSSKVYTPVLSKNRAYSQ